MSGARPMPDLRRTPSHNETRVHRVGKETGMNKFLLAIASVVLGTASVQAADLAAHYTKAPVMAPVYNWTGFYVGGNVGGQWGSANPATTTLFPVAAYFA